MCIGTEIGAVFMYVFERKTRSVCCSAKNDHTYMHINVCTYSKLYAPACILHNGERLCCFILIVLGLFVQNLDTAQKKACLCARITFICFNWTDLGCNNGFLGNANRFGEARVSNIDLDDSFQQAAIKIPYLY